MKTHLLLPAALLLFTRAAAQDIPNAGFEEWTDVNGDYFEPDGWFTFNADLAPLEILTCERGTPAVEGNYYAKLTTHVFNGITLSGFMGATEGNDPQLGFPYTQRPSALTGKWQYQLLGLDQGMISVVLSRWNTTTGERQTVGAGMSLFTGSLTSWEDFNIPITYGIPDVPDSAVITFFASAGQGTEGSTLSIDALAFNTSTQVAEPSAQAFVIHPSPAAETVHVRASQPVVALEVLDLRGRSVSAPVLPGSNAVQVVALPPGFYLLRARLADGSIEQRTFLKE